MSVSDPQVDWDTSHPSHNYLKNDGPRATVPSQTKGLCWRDRSPHLSNHPALGQETSAWAVSRVDGRQLETLEVPCHFLGSNPQVAWPDPP